MPRLHPRLRDLAMQRIEILLENAVKNSRHRRELAQRQASIARRIAERINLRLPHGLRQLYCRRCKKFITPGVNARVRLGRNPTAVKITCLECGRTYRKILRRGMKT